MRATGVRLMNRRVFVFTATSASLGLGYLAQPFVKYPVAEGFLFGLGSVPPGSMPYVGQKGANSALTVFHLSTKKWRMIRLPFAAHSMVATGHGFAAIGKRSTVGIFDRELNMIRSIEAPVSWVFGGHGQWLTEQNRLALSLKPAYLSGLISEGKIIMVNPDNGLITDEKGSGGFEPHDIKLLTDGSLAVCNYGNKTSSDLDSYGILNPKLALLNSKTLDVNTNIDAPKMGALSHCEEGPPGIIGAIPAKLALISDDSLNQVGHLLLDTPAELTPVEIVEGKIGYPTPVLMFDQSSSKWRSFFTDPEKQRRPQSIAYHKEAQCWFVTYPFSEQIMKLSVHGEITFFSAFDLGISYPRGICVTNTGRLFVSGQYRGLAEIDPFKGHLVERWNVPFYDSTHLQFLT